MAKQTAEFCTLEWISKGMLTVETYNAWALAPLSRKAKPIGISFEIVRQLNRKSYVAF